MSEPLDRLSRRDALRLIVGGLGGAALLGAGPGCVLAGPAVFGAVDPDEPPLGEAGRRLLAKAWEGLDPAACWDTHVHLVGLGVGGTGCRVAEKMRSPVNFGRYLKYLVYRRASGIRDEADADRQYVARLVGLKRDWSPKSKLLVFAFDDAHDEQGRRLPHVTDFHTPNEYARDTAAAHPDDLEWAASIHPYRADAPELLDRCVEEGARAVKWLPNAQLMDASKALCDPFYDRLVHHGIPLITHVGMEQAVEAADNQRFGNPLRFRRPLDRGVKIIMAHASSLGEDNEPPIVDPDVDDGIARKRVESFRLFMDQLFTNPDYERTLLCDLSALTQFNRCDKLAELLEATGLHDRLLYSTDYPLPAINVIVRMNALVKLGYIDDDQADAARELYAHNPLSFAFALLRRIRSKGKRFADSAFDTRRHFITG